MTLFRDSAFTEWLWTYNNERPSRALGGIPPKSAVIGW